MADADLEDLEWEEWDGKGSFGVHCVAGSIAGIAEHTLIYPFDTIKTHMQCANCPQDVASCPKKTAKPTPRASMHVTLANLTGSANALSATKSERAFLRLWRGVNSMVVACVPAHALYFSSFEISKSALGVDKVSRSVRRASKEKSSLGPVVEANPSLRLP